MSSTSTRPRLVVTGGPLDGRELVLDEGTERRFGTSAECDLQVQAGHLEAVHASVALESGHLMLSDAGSVAGTYVNGEKVGQGRELFDGDRVCLGPPGFRGSVKMVVAFDAPAAEAGAEAALLDPADFAPSPGAVPDAPLDLGAATADDGFRLDDAAPTTASAPDEGEDWTLAAPEAEAVPAADVMVEPEPEPQPEVVPQAPAAAAAPRPAAHVATAADYSQGISIAPETPRAPGALPSPAALSKPAAAGPPAARAAPRASAPRPGTDWKRILIVNGIVVAVAVLALVAWRAVHRPRAVLSALSAAQARAGETLTVQGLHLGGTAAEWTVHFGDLTAAPTAATEESITVAVPAALAKSGPPQVPVSVEGPGGKSNELVLRIVRGPAITALEPDVALAGQTIRLKGSNLAGEGAPTVTVGDQEAKVVSARPNEVEITVPSVDKPEGSTLEVRVRVGAELGAPAKMTLGRLPLLRSLDPGAGRAGLRVKLGGRGLDDGAQVTFDGTPALVVSVKADELTVVAPPLLGASETQVVVRTRAGTSAPTAFRYESASAAIFVPQFVAVPVLEHEGHDHAAVATALGPVLVLSGRDGDRTSAQRAADAADALNVLVGSASSGQPVPLSARAEPPAVLGPGSGPAVLNVTAEDAASFAETWTGVKPVKIAPAALATYWAALVQDHLTLFVVHARPLRLLDLTPRGQLLLDVWSSAVRQGHGKDGVPVRQIAPVPDTLARGIRELALSPVAPGAGTPALALAGSWTGSITEKGEPRPVGLRLVAAGRGLKGSMTTQAGSVTMDLPLRDLSYQNGELKFTVLAGNSPRTFKGLFDGRQLNGTITGTSGPIGDFRLELVE